MLDTAKIYLGTVSLKSHLQYGLEKTQKVVLPLKSPDNLIQDFFVRQKSLARAEPETPASPPSRHFRDRVHLLYVGLVVFSAVLLLSGLWYGYHDFQINRQSATRANKLVAQANAVNTSLPSVQTTTAASTIKPSTSAVASYSVAANLPRSIMIPKLGVDARILAVGVTKSGALETPGNVYDTAWYSQSAQPGQPGALLIDGHVSSWTTHGVFYGIKTLVAGDTIEVERGDGKLFTYKVIKTQIYNASNVDMNAALTPIIANHPGLNLITCTGDVIPGTNEFSERIMVFAEQT